MRELPPTWSLFSRPTWRVKKKIRGLLDAYSLGLKIFPTPTHFLPRSAPQAINNDRSLGSQKVVRAQMLIVDWSIPASQIASPNGAHSGFRWALRAHCGFFMGFAWILHQKDHSGSERASSVSIFPLWWTWVTHSRPCKTHVKPMWVLFARVGPRWDLNGQAHPCKSHRPTVTHAKPVQDFDGLAIWAGCRTGLCRAT